MTNSAAGFERSTQRLTPTGDAALRRIFALLTLATAGMAAVLSLLPPAGHDQLWFLLMAQRWLGGAQLYGSAAFDSNPPAIVWLSALPILLGHALHLSTPFAAKLLVVLAESSASLLSYRFLRGAMPTGLDATGQRRGYVQAALLFAAMVLFYVIPARDFGQRDQILSFLVLPYLLAAAVDPLRRRMTLARCTAGVLAAVGICMKPHQAMVIVAVELALLLSPSLTNRRPFPTRLRRLLRPEPVIVVALGLAFLASVHRLTPLYFTLALPVLRDTYWAIGHLSLGALAWQAIELCVLAAICLAVFVLRRPASPAIAVLLVAGGAATLAYLLQGTGWYYQQLPALSFFGAALTLQLLDLLEQVPFAPPRWAVPATAALGLLAVALTAHFTGYPLTRQRAYAAIFTDPALPDPRFFTTLPPGTPVAIFTTSVEDSMMPVERYHMEWAQRTNNLWTLPAILRSESGPPPRRILAPARVTQLDAMQHRWMVEDLTHWQPELVLVQRCQDPAVVCQELEDRHDDLLAWFRRDPAFASLWGRYAFCGSRGDFDAYTLRPVRPRP